MSEDLSTVILARLRSEAQALGRPEIRLASLDRLEEACNAIANGTAKALIKRWNPKAYPNWTLARVPIIPPRIEEYVLAEQAKERSSGVDRPRWTGPVASSLRKESGGMLAYVRARNDEHEPADIKSGRARRAHHDWWQLLDGIDDDLQRSELLRELTRGREAMAQNVMLRKATRLLSESFDLEAYLRGEPAITEQHQKALAPPAGAIREDLPILSPEDATAIAGLVGRLSDPQSLGGFELETDGRRVFQRKTRAKLVEAPEMAVLRRLARAET